MARLQIALAVLALAPWLSGQQGSVERGRLRGRVVHIDGAAWAGARVFFASTLFPNAVDASIQDTVEVRSDERGYFHANLLEDRSYAAWAAEVAPPRADGLRVYRTSQVAAAGVGRALRLVESTQLAVRVPCTLPGGVPTGSRWIARGLIHPPAQAEAIQVALDLETDAGGLAWTPLWPSELVPLELVAPDGAVLGRSRVLGNLGNAQRLPRRDGKVDVAQLGQLGLRKLKPPAGTFAVSGRIVRDGRPFHGIVVVRDVAVGFRERVVRTDATGAWQLSGVKAPVEVWCRDSSGELPELYLVGSSSGQGRSDLGTVELTKLQSTQVQIKTNDGSRAERAVIAIDSFERKLAVLRSFAGRRGRIRISRARGVDLAVAARWSGGIAAAKLPPVASCELVGREPVTITGRVIDIDGKAQPSTLVSLGVRSEDIGERFRFLVPTRSWTDADGRFRVTLPVAEWNYFVAASRFLPNGRIGSTRVIIDKRVHGVPIELQLDS